MAVLFSAVTLTAGNNQAEFLAAGIPRDTDDLEGWTAYENFIAIDHDMEVDCDEGREITVYIETWFDVDKKFHIDTASDDDTWLNMYGRYNPFDDTLRIECEISR